MYLNAQYLVSLTVSIKRPFVTELLVVDYTIWLYFVR